MKHPIVTFLIQSSLLHLLIGLLLFCFFFFLKLCRLTCLFTSVWTHGFLFYMTDYSPFQSLCMSWWEALPAAGFCVLPTTSSYSKTLLTFWDEMFWLISLLPLLSQPFL